MEKIISVYSNNKSSSPETEEILTEKFRKLGFDIVKGLCNRADILVCIGGDGTFLTQSTSVIIPLFLLSVSIQDILDFSRMFLLTE